MDPLRPVRHRHLGWAALLLDDTELGPSQVHVSSAATRCRALRPPTHLRGATTLLKRTSLAHTSWRNTSPTLIQLKKAIAVDQQHGIGNRVKKYLQQLHEKTEVSYGVVTFPAGSTTRARAPSWLFRKGGGGKGVLKLTKANISTMSNTVHVKGISSSISEEEVCDFLSFCGKIQSLSVTPESSDILSGQSATITFENETDLGLHSSSTSLPRPDVWR
ncbi:Protein vip1 [Elasticomyces elasticus]|nr:Protein vip1 [Elasticomyces elasticus]